jgi:hypothetical protein
LKEKKRMSGCSKILHTKRAWWEIIINSGGERVGIEMEEEVGIIVEK